MNIERKTVQIHDDERQGPGKVRRRSGFTYSWKLWRHCCCRYGTYPLIVAPIVTAACLFSLYASAGCDFVRVDVGFSPSNEAWNESKAELGLFNYQSGEPETNKYREALLDGCRWYEEDFDEEFIEGDRTWKVARIMAYISGGASICATVTAWMFVFTPLPAFFFWPAVLLPSLMCAFLAEGSKFLFFDTAICRSPVWFPSGEDSPPRVAEDCTIGRTGVYSIAAGAILFVSLILVCLKAPEKRKLEEHYGRRFDRTDVESAREVGDFEGSYDDRGSADSYEEAESSTRDPPKMRNFDYGSYGEDGFQENESQTSRPINLDEEDIVSARLKSLDPQEDKYTAKPTDDESLTKDRYDPTKPVAKADARPTPDQAVSKSRLNARERMELNTASQSQELIEKFVSDLNMSFKADNNTDAKKGDEKPDFFENICGTTVTTCDTPHTAQSF